MDPVQLSTVPSSGVETGHASDTIRRFTEGQ